MTVRHRRRSAVMTVIGIVVVGIYLFPLYWMVATSLKSEKELFTSPPTWIPLQPQIDAYTKAVLSNPEILQSLGNSLIISVGTLVLTLLLAAPAAYGMARLKFRYSGLMLLPFLIVQLLPSINIAVPLFAIFSAVGLVNSLFALVLANTVMTLPFAVIVLRPFCLSVPRELEESAAIDGCNRLGIFMRIVIPLVRPGLITVGAFSFVMAWGEFTLGLTLASDSGVQPVTVALNAFVGQYGTEWARLMALATVIAIPIVVIFTVLQRFITSGLTAGAVNE